MPMTADERQQVAQLAQAAYPIVQELFTIFTTRGNVPPKFGLGVYDASDGGPDFAKGGTAEARALAEFKIGEADWGDRDYIATARRKTAVALRLGKNTGDVARNTPDLFEEGEMRAPGAVLGEVAGHPIVVAGSGLRGPEDEALAVLLLHLMMRMAA